MTRTGRIVAVTALAAAGMLGALGAGAFSSSSPGHSKSYRDGYAFWESVVNSPYGKGSLVGCVSNPPFVVSIPRGDNPAQWKAGCIAAPS
jgi:hypothetical protein